MTRLIKAFTKNRTAALIACVCALTLASNARAQATARKDAISCPACACEPPMAGTKGDRFSNVAGCILGGDQSKGAVWVRLGSMHSREHLAARTDNAGRFSFKNVADGDYLLVATQDKKVLALTEIRLPSNISVVVDVEPFRTGGIQIEY